MTLSDITQGELMYYGGIAGIAILILLSFIIIIFFVKIKRKLIRKIEDDF